MAGEYYRVRGLSLVAGLFYDDLLPALLAGGMPTALVALLDAATGTEPATVVSADQGVRNRVAAVDLTSFQGDWAVNQLPQAAGGTTLGRDLGRLAAGATDLAAADVAELLVRYLGDARVRARVYGREAPGPAAGVAVAADARVAPAEDVLLFDGYLTGVSTRDAAEGSQECVLAFAHVLSDLAASSAVSAQIAAASAHGWAFHAALSPYLLTPEAAAQQAGVGVMTLAGAAQLTVASGPALETDFWGYWAPPLTASDGESYGIQHFLLAVCRQDLFAWQNFRSRALVAAAANCPAPAANAPPPTNAAAAAALGLIEPFTRTVAADPAAVRQTWDALHTALRVLLEGEDAAAGFGQVPGVDRGELLGLARDAYYAAGYRYGMPLAFRKSDLVYGSFSAAYAFARGLTGERVETLGPVSLWDKLVGEYGPRYGFALCPMAARAALLPLTPSLRRVWRTVYASEVLDCHRSADIPVPIRGVVLLGHRPSITGVGQGSTPAAPAVGPAEQFVAAYDGCRPGQFIFRPAPDWLSNAAAVFAPAAAHAQLDPARARVMAAAPQTARDSRAAAAALVGPAARAAGVSTSALAALTPARRAMGYAYAKSLYQYERLRHRTARVTTHYRTDVGPGSTVAVELSGDPAADAALRRAGGTPAAAGRYAVGVVQRVSLVVDNRGALPQAHTAFELGFVRQPAETAAASDLSSDGHPVWGTVVAGIPLVDSLALRAQLADHASLDE